MDYLHLIYPELLDAAILDPDQIGNVRDDEIIKPVPMSGKEVNLYHSMFGLLPWQVQDVF